MSPSLLVSPRQDPCRGRCGARNMAQCMLWSTGEINNRGDKVWVGGGGGGQDQDCVHEQMRPIARGQAQHGGPPGWLEDRVCVILYVKDGPCRLPCRTVAAAAQLSSCCYKVNVPSWLKSWMAGRGRLSIITAPCARVCCLDNYSKHWLPASLENLHRLSLDTDSHKSGLLIVNAVKVSAREWRKEKYRAEFLNF